MAEPTVIGKIVVVAEAEIVKAETPDPEAEEGSA